MTFLRILIRSTLSVEHDPAMLADKPFPETGIHPSLRVGMLLGIMLWLCLKKGAGNEASTS